MTKPKKPKALKERTGRKKQTYVLMTRTNSKERSNDYSIAHYGSALVLLCKGKRFKGYAGIAYLKMGRNLTPLLISKSGEITTIEKRAAKLGAIG